MNRLVVCVFVLFGTIEPSPAAKMVAVAGAGTTEKDAPALECKLREPFAVEFSPAGEMLIAEMTSGNRVLRVDGKGVLRVLAGTGAKGFSGDGGPATAATFNGSITRRY
jgi:hypothetical protein